MRHKDDDDDEELLFVMPTVSDCSKHCYSNWLVLVGQWVCPHFIFGNVELLLSYTKVTSYFMMIQKFWKSF